MNSSSDSNNVDDSTNIRESAQQSYGEALLKSLGGDIHQNGESHPLIISHGSSSLIAIIVGSLPILALVLILLGFKLYFRLCVQGSRPTDFQLPRRISSLSTTVTGYSISRSSSIVGGNSGCGIHCPPPSVHHHPNCPPTIRSDGTPLVTLELETITEGNGSEDFDLDAPPDLSCSSCTYQVYQPLSTNIQ